MISRFFRFWMLSGVLLLGVSVVRGQYTYQPFIKEGKVWNMYGIFDRNDRHDHDFQYVMRGDTVIGGVVMKKVHVVDEEYFHNNDLHYLGAVEETDKRVYITYAGENTSILLYDFNLESCSPESPSVFHYDGNYASQIERIYLIQRNSTLRHEQRGRRYYPPEVMEMIAYSVQIDEGIGSVMQMDPFQYQLWGKNWVTSCYDDGACLYYVRDNSGVGYEVEPTYISLLKHRRQWNCHDTASGKETTHTVLGDTLFYNDENKNSGKLYRKIYCVDSQKYGDTELHYYGAMREEGKKVYLIPDGKGKDDCILVFDFDLKTGYQAEVAGCTVMVTETEEIELEGKKYRRLTLHQIENGKDTKHECHWTEGIGSDCGLLLPLPWDAAQNQQLTVSDNDISTFNPSLNIWDIEIPFEETRGTAEYPLYDLQGRRLNSEPRKGVYVKNGKKVVIK